MYKALIFDCFGVLTTEGWTHFCDHFFGNDPKRRQLAHNLADKLNLGKVDHEFFLEAASNLANITKTEAQKLIENNAPNAPLFELIAELKPKYKVGMLSNAGADWLHELFTDAQLGLIDDFVLSYQVGLLKPQPAIYELAAQRLGVSTEECIFIDDQPRYIEAAEALGMKGIVYESFAQAASDIKKLVADSDH